MEGEGAELILLVFLLLFGSLWHEDYFIAHSFSVLVIGVGYLLYQFRYHYRASFLAFSGYYAVSCLAQIELSGLNDRSYLVQNYIGSRTLLVLACALLFTHLTLHLDEKKGLRCIASIGVLASFFSYSHKHMMIGLWNNHSVNVAMLTILAAYLNRSGWFLFLPIILIDGGRTPWAIIGLYAISYFSFKVTYVNFVNKGVALIIVSCILLWKNGLRTVPFSDRLDTWKMGLWNAGNYWIGNGVGSWYIRIPFLQKAMGQTYLWTTAHNDYLQLFFETGIIGLVLFLWAFGEAIYRATGPAKYSLLGLIIFMAFFFAFEMPGTLVLLIFLMGRALAIQKRRGPFVDKELTRISEQFFGGF